MQDDVLNKKLTAQKFGLPFEAVQYSWEYGTGKLNFPVSNNQSVLYIYKSLTIQVSIQDVGSNASFIGAEGRNDYFDVKKFHY